VKTPRTNSAGAETDHFARFIVCWVFGIPAILVLLAASPLGTNFVYVMTGIPTLLLIWAALGLWSVIRCFAFVMRRRWRLSALALVLPVVVCLAGLNF
jgi:hypothetical protein